MRVAVVSQDRTKLVSIDSGPLDDSSRFVVSVLDQALLGFGEHVVAELD